MSRPRQVHPLEVATQRVVSELAAQGVDLTHREMQFVRSGLTWIRVGLRDGRYSPTALGVTAGRAS